MGEPIILGEREVNMMDDVDNETHIALTSLRKLTEPSRRFNVKTGNNIEQSSNDILEIFRETSESRYERIRTLIHPCISKLYELVDKRKKSITLEDENEEDLDEEKGVSFLSKHLLLFILEQEGDIVIRNISTHNEVQQFHRDDENYENALGYFFANLRHAEVHNNMVSASESGIKFRNMGSRYRNGPTNDFVYEVSYEMMYKICRYLVFLVYELLRDGREKLDKDYIGVLLSDSKNMSDGFMIILHVHSYLTSQSSHIDIYEYDIIKYVSMLQETVHMNCPDYEIYDAKPMAHIGEFIPYWLYNASKNADYLCIEDVGLGQAMRTQAFSVIHFGLILTEIGCNIKDVVIFVAKAIKYVFEKHSNYEIISQSQLIDLQEMLCSTLRTLMALQPIDRGEFTSERDVFSTSCAKLYTRRLEDLLIDACLEKPLVKEGVRLILIGLLNNNMYESIECIRNSPWNAFINRLAKRLAFGGNLKKLYYDFD